MRADTSAVFDSGDDSIIDLGMRRILKFCCEYDVAKLSLCNVTNNIMVVAVDLIDKVLTEKTKFSGKEFINLFKSVGLEDEIEYMYIYDRDDE